MADDNEQYRQRLANLAAIGDLGVDPYPREFARTASIRVLVDEHGGRSGDELETLQPQAAAAGRILGIRSFGKANFLVLSDGQARIQAYIRKDAVTETEFAVFKRLDFGDFVGVRGRVFRTKTGSSRSGRRRWCSWRSASDRCPRSGTGCRTSRRATASAISISS